MCALSLDTALPATSSRVWPDLPMELAERIVSHIHPNCVACNIRLINKAAALRFRGPQHTTIRLSQPVPPDAFARHWLAPGTTCGLNLKQRRKLLCLTAASGSVQNLEVTVRAAGCLPTHEVFQAAAAAGSLETCQWLHQQGYPMGWKGPLSGGRVLNAAASGGHMHVCEWLLTLDVTWWWGAEEEAAAHGHIDLMEWLQERRLQLRYEWLPAEGADRTELMMAAVAKGCDLATLQRLWPRCWGELAETDKAQVLDAAAGSPTPDWAAKVEWLEGQGCPRTKYAAMHAVFCSDALARLKWLQGRGYPLRKRAVAMAPVSGNAAALQFLLEEGVRPQPGDMFAAARAAEAGHLTMLQMLRAAGLRLCGPAGAAARGHLHVVAWLVETLRGTLLDAELFAAAAESGSVELMAWLRQRGCGWDAAAFTAAAGGGCEEALEWLVAQGCPVPDDGLPYRAACLQGDVATARCLRRLGVSWGAAAELLAGALRELPPPMLRWLLEAGCPIDCSVVEAKAEGLSSSGDLGDARLAEVLLDTLRRHRQQQQQQQAERV